MPYGFLGTFAALYRLHSLFHSSITVKGGVSDSGCTYFDTRDTERVCKSWRLSIERAIRNIVFNECNLQHQES